MEKMLDFFTTKNLKGKSKMKEKKKYGLIQTWWEQKEKLKEDKKENLKKH